jgi:hypothetical protein
MNCARLFHFLMVRLLPLLVLGLLSARSMAQADPPSRVARLNHLEGAAVFAPAGDNEWIDAVLNRPLTRGDRVWTDKGSRAELQVGSSAVRMDGQAHLEILALDDRSAQLSVTQGTVYVRVRSLPDGENFEIDTPNLAYRAAYPGDYRIDVNANTGTTRVTIHSGTGAVYGEDGQVLTLGGGQQITFRSRDLSQMAAQESPPQDNFDRWAADRNRREDQSVSARYVPREVVGYQQLDAHGQWMQDATYGPVWFPQGLPANWAPYRNGHWEWISPWGWTWIDAAAWGFAPFHYGRWAMIDSRWAWVPGRIALKPVYAPALVAFIGGDRSGFAWFPLAPGEAWQPAYRASALYISNVNGNLPVQADATYAHQRKPEALTSISTEDFHRGRPVGAGWLRVAANTLTNAQIVPPPPMPERSIVAQRKPAAVARALPPAPPKVQIAAAPAARVQVPMSAQEQDRPPAKQAKAAKAAGSAIAAAPTVQAKSGAQAKSAEQAKSAAQIRRAEQKPAEEARAEQAMADEAKRDKLARRAEQARREQFARRAEQTKREQLAKQAEQARRDQQLARQAEQARREQQLAKQAEQARRDQQLAKQAEQARQAELAKRELAKRDQARRELLARKAEQVKREEQAKREDLAKREAVARRDEQQRREAHARQVEQARRAADREAQALREQREQREELQAQREAQEREQAQQREQAAQRAAWARQQQAISEQWRRDHRTWEQQQRERARQRPDLRDDRDDRRARPPEPQRGIPIIAGPWS